MYISSMLDPDYKNVIVWERKNGKRIRKIYDPELNFYVKYKDGEYKDVYGNNLAKLEFNTSKEYFQTRKELRIKEIDLYESDISLEQKILSKYYYNTAIPELNIVFFDIEVDYDKFIGFSGVKNPYAPINSISLYFYNTNERLIITIPPQYSPYNPSDTQYSIEDCSTKLLDSCKIIFCKDEKELLNTFLDSIKDYDLISGWNSDYFDVPYIYKRINKILGPRSTKRLCFQNSKNPIIREVEREIFEGFKTTEEIVILYGRKSIDYKRIYQKFVKENKSSYSLDNIAKEELLNYKKLEYEGSLYDLYRNDFIYYLEYNMVDTEIIVKLEEKLKYLNLAIELSHMATTEIESVYGTIRLAESAIINYCNYVLNARVPDSKRHDYYSKYGGAIVFEPEAGEYNMIGSVDVESLYPTALICINASPETLIAQFVENEAAYINIFNNTGELLTLHYEDGNIETKTTDEWKKYFQTEKYALSAYGTVFSQTKDGFIPAILKEWFDERKKYKKLMNEYKIQLENIDENNSEYMELKLKFELYDRFQHIKKIQLNSLYGCMGNKYFKFFDIRLAESTTKTGREILFHLTRQIGKDLNGKYEYPNDSVIYGDSVAKDSLLYVDDGNSQTIENLFDSIDNIIGDKEYHHPENLKVLTYDSNINKSCYKPVKYIMRHKNRKKMFRVWFTNSTYIDVTEDHSLMGYVNVQKRKTCNSPLHEVKPEEIGNDIKTIIWLKRIPRLYKLNSKEYSKEFFEIMGLVIGDGGCHSINSGVELSLGFKDKDEIIEKTITPLIEQGLATSIIHKKNGHDIRICGTRLWRELYKNLYNKNGYKRIPEWLKFETEENICSFLRGYFTADGGISGNSIKLSSISLDNILSARHLLFLVGISSNYFTETKFNSYKGKISNTKTKALIVKSSIDFKEKVGFILDRKNNKIMNPGKKRICFKNYDFEITEVKHIEEIEYTDYVYDVEIEDTHTFFANNVLVHNTDSAFFKTYTDNLNDAKKICKHIEDSINDSYPDFMKNKFFCIEKNANRVKVQNEIISDLGIFVSKKIYLLHLIYKNGYNVDEMKIMGHAVKKTTITTIVKDALNNILENYFKLHDWKQLNKDVVKFKNVLYDSKHLEDYGIPGKVKKVEYYTEELKANPLVNLPGKQAPAIFWNLCLERYEDKESMPITSETSVRTYYLTTKIGRFKSISVPVDLHIIPEWFTENIIPIIDKNYQINRLVDKTLSNICSAVGRAVPTDKAVLADEVLVFE